MLSKTVPFLVVPQQQATSGPVRSILLASSSYRALQLTSLLCCVREGTVLSRAGRVDTARMHSHRLNLSAVHGIHRHGMRACTILLSASIDSFENGVKGFYIVRGGSGACPLAERTTLCARVLLIG
eukprot:SAG22_NODE_178_length_16142_cov_13.187995_7_plen_126_part_00